MKIIPIVLLAIIPAFVACKDTEIKSIEREEIFSLNIGLMEDQLALYNLVGQGTGKKPGFAMRDGFFYIADGTVGKIVSYNSYGDLLFMIYNEETNPAPVSLRINNDENKHVTRWAYTYPLREPGEITVDSRKHIFVEERLPHERHRFDPDNRVLLDRIVLHFDADGRFVEYLGQEGIGGSPFPRINGLYTSQNDELAVVCRLPSAWNVYWYSSGTLLYLIQLKNHSVPVPSEWPDVYSSVDTVVAATDARRVYIKVDYYRETIDESTNMRTGHEPYGSIIWILNAEDGLYIDSVRLPFYETAATESNRPDTFRLLYSMLGAVRNGRFFLYYPEDNGFSIMVVNANIHENRRGFIEVDSNTFHYNVFNLSYEGILSAMAVDDWKVSMLWWRTDRFFGISQ